MTVIGPMGWGMVAVARHPVLWLAVHHRRRQTVPGSWDLWESEWRLCGCHCMFHVGWRGAAAAVACASGGDGRLIKCMHFITNQVILYNQNYH